MNPPFHDAIAREATALAAAGTPPREAAAPLWKLAAGSPYLLKAAREELLDQLETAAEGAVPLVEAVRLLNAALDLARESEGGAN